VVEIKVLIKKIYTEVCNGYNQYKLQNRKGFFEQGKGFKRFKRLKGLKACLTAGRGLRCLKGLKVQ
jgi:hypothetical protein